MHHFDHCSNDNFARLCDSNKQTVNSWWLHAGFFLIHEKSDACRDAVFYLATLSSGECVPPTALWLRHRERECLWVVLG